MPHAHRLKVVVGNWKMHKTIAESVLFIEKLIPKVVNSKVRIWLAVPFTALNACTEIARQSSVVIGGQNVNEHESGAFTGEISCSMLKDAGATFVILGHSERRNLFHETDACINKKLKRALQDNLQPIVCFGETLEQHQSGQSYSVVEEQLKRTLSGINEEELGNIILAYEPVWAIGTNLTATPEQAENIHKFCRDFLSRNWTSVVAEKIVILYGGSVKPDNASALIKEPNVDGLLVGGSSLSVDSFSKIIDCFNINIS